MIEKRQAIVAAAAGGLCALVAAVPSHAREGEIVRCSAKGHASIIISLNVRRELRRSLSCISGDFIADLTPCAPDGGIGLSAPTGTAPLVAVVNRWQDAIDHLGGRVSHSINSHEISFSGGFGSSRGNWSFVADRLTGQGQLKLDNKLRAVKYTCVKARQRF
jgi:hypothetical protein